MTANQFSALSLELAHTRAAIKELTKKESDLKEELNSFLDEKKLDIITVGSLSVARSWQTRESWDTKKLSVFFGDTSSEYKTSCRFSTLKIVGA